MSIQVKDIVVKTIDYRLDDPLFASVKKQILDMLPEPEVKMSFNLLNANPFIMNAIRAVMCAELRVKALWFKVKKVVTDDKTVILEALRDRISLIHINQNIPLDAEFALNYVNDNLDAPRSWVKSSDMKQVKGKHFSEQPFGQHHRLWMMTAESSLKIPRIRVKEGIGRDAAMFCLTRDFKCRNLDYTYIHMLNEKGNLVRTVVNTSELLDAMRSQKIKMPDAFQKKSYHGIYKPKILYIPDTNHMSLATEITKDRIRKSFPVILEDMELPQYSSLHVEPRDYWLQFVYKHGDPKHFMRLTCANIMERLERISAYENVTVQTYDKVTEFIIKGEMDTIGRMLEYQIYELNPELGMVGLTKIHPKTEIIKIKMISVKPEELFKAAVSELIKKFKIISAEFA